MDFCYSKLTFHILRTADPPPPGAATRVDDGTDELSAAQLDRPHVSMNVWHVTHSPQQQNGQQQSRTVKSSHSGFSERGSSCSDLTFSFCLSKILSIFCQPLSGLANFWLAHETWPQFMEACWTAHAGPFHPVQTPPNTYSIPSSQTTLIGKQRPTGI